MEPKITTAGTVLVYREGGAYPSEKILKEVAELWNSTPEVGFWEELYKADSWGKACAEELERVKAERDGLRGQGSSEPQALFQGAAKGSGWEERLTAQGVWEHRDPTLGSQWGEWGAMTTLDDAHVALAKRLLAEYQIDKLGVCLAEPDEAPLVEIELVQEWVGDLDLVNDGSARNILDRLVTYLLSGTAATKPTYAITDENDDELPF